MKISTEKLSDDILDYAVQACSGQATPALAPLEQDLINGEVLPYSFDLHHDIKLYSEVLSILRGEPHRSGLGAQELRAFAAEMGYTVDKPHFPQFSRDWALMGPLKVDAGICSGPSTYGGYWAGQGAINNDDEQFLGMTGDTELRAIARCYVFERLGKFVEVPVELQAWCREHLTDHVLEDAPTDRPRNG